MNLNLIRLLSLCAMLVYHIQSLYYAQRIQPSGTKNREQWFIVVVLLNSQLLSALEWSDTKMFWAYILYFVIYLVECPLLFGGGILSSIFLAGIFPYLLLCVQGIIIPLLSLMYQKTLYQFVADDALYALSLFVSLLVCILLVGLSRTWISAEQFAVLMRSRAQKRFVCVSLCLLLAYLIIETYVYYYEFWGIWVPVFHMITSAIALTAFCVVLRHAIELSIFIEYEINTRQVQKQLHRQVVHYKQYTNHINQLREFKHDCKHMVETVCFLLNSGAQDKALALLGQMDAEMETSLVYSHFSNHVVVDAIMQECAERCQEHGIAFTASAHIPDQIGLSDLELCRLFGNLADNAVEACLRCDQKEKFISVTCSMTGAWVTVVFSNSFSGKLMMEDGLPVSRKQATQHGMGLRSVRTLAEKTGGFLQIAIDEQKGIFTVHLHLSTMPSETSDTPQQ